MEMRSWLRIALLGVVVIWPSTIWSEESGESFDIVVPQTPIPVVTKAQVMLVYELHLTNFAAEPLSVKRLRIRESDTGRELVSFAEASLAHRISFVSGGHSSHESSTDEAIPPGERAVIFVEFTAKIGASRTSSARDRLYR
jgi:murein DD-endopeptidase